MTIDISSNTYLVFDLDDTLYKEIDFLKSAYRSIVDEIVSRSAVFVIGEVLYREMLNLYYNNEDVFKTIISKYEVAFTKADLIEIYRNHYPSIDLLPGLKEIFVLLNRNRIKYGIITDGRSTTQSNKLKALGVFAEACDIVVSEEVGKCKPNKANYTLISNKYENYDFYYFGDNPKKDFISPNLLGWTTVCLIDDGSNIHKQDLGKLTENHMAQSRITTWKNLEFRIVE